MIFFDKITYSKKLFQVITPLLVGFLIYLFFHKPNLILHSYLAEYIQIPNFFNSFNHNKIFIFLLNHIPDILWIYSLGNFLIFACAFIKNKWVKAAIIIAIGSITEIIQLLFPLNFTFDWLDLFFIIFTLSLICYNYEIKDNI